MVLASACHPSAEQCHFSRTKAGFRGKPCGGFSLIYSKSFENQKFGAALHSPGHVTAGRIALFSNLRYDLVVPEKQPNSCCISGGPVMSRHASRNEAMLDPVIGTMRCECCGRRMECSRSQASLFLQENKWPMCCRFIMILEPLDAYRTPEPPDPRTFMPNVTV